MDSRTERPYAVVTGASGGIGKTFAEHLAATHDLLLVARSTDKLTALGSELSTRVPDGRFGVLSADLSTPEGPAAILRHVGEDSVDLVVNNAGSGYNGAFADQPADRIAAEIALDCAAVALIARGLLPGMVRRGRGAIINVASSAAFQPTPGMALYGASKAFVLSLSESLSYETKDTGVHVLALCPGPVETDFFTNAGADFLTSRRMSPDDVVAAALVALRRGRTVEVPGLSNKIGSIGSRLAPRKVMTAVSARIVRSN